MSTSGLRQIGAWTYREKLGILKDYLDAYVVATKRARHKYYIDGFAGSGKAKLRDSDLVVHGSPLIALKVKSPFDRYYLIEMESECVQFLRREVDALPALADRVEIVQGDCNEKVAEVVAAIPERAPCFAFLDPSGPHLLWATIEKIAKQRRLPDARKIELLILFPYNMTLARFLPYEPSKLKHEELLDLVMPDREAWRELYQRRAALSPGEFRRRFVSQYLQGLKGLGYKYVPPARLVCGAGIGLYFLIFASDHAAGERIMRHVFNKRRRRNAQMPLFELDYGDEY